MNALSASTSISSESVSVNSCSIESSVVGFVDRTTRFGGKAFGKADLRGGSDVATSNFENIGRGKGGGERWTRPLALKT